MEFTNLIKQVTQRDKLATTTCYYDSSKQSKNDFHPFLRRLEEIMQGLSSTQKLRMLFLATDPFTQSRIKHGLGPLEVQWAEDNAIEGASEASEGHKQVESPFGTGNVFIVQDGVQPAFLWADARLAILSGVLGEDGLMAAERRLDHPQPLRSYEDIDRHNFDFRILVDNYLDLGGTRGEAWLADRYYSTIPKDVTYVLPCFSRDLRGAMAEVTAACKNRQRIDAIASHSGATGSSRVVPSSSSLAFPSASPTAPPPSQRGSALVRDRASYAQPRPEVAAVLARLQQADQRGSLAAEAVKVTGCEPCWEGIASMTSAEYATLKAAVSDSLPSCGTREVLVATISQLLPKTWTRTTRHTTETTGAWDLAQVASKDELAKSYALNRYVAGLKKATSVDADDEDPEEEPAPPPPKKRAKSHSINVATQRAWDSGFAVRDVLAALSNKRIACHHCSGPHLVRVCEKLKQPDGTYSPFCTYCGDVGHEVGPLRQTTCPTLARTVCPGCQETGHTFDFCYKNVCKKCKKDGHTSFVCRQKETGEF